MHDLRLRHLFLKNYRNYDELDLSFNSNLTLLIGKNAQGKTNILESIFLTCTARSHRTSKDRELIKWNKDDAYIKTKAEKDAGNSLIEIKLSKKEKKQVKINGIQINRMGELMGHLNSVIFSPEDLKLVKDGPSERRRYMDMVLSQISPKYFYYLQQYNRILYQRNHLLKSINRNHSLKKTLGTWNYRLAEVGSYIIVQRILFNSALKKIAYGIHKRISNNLEELSVDYYTPIPYKNQEQKDIREIFLMELESCENRDIERGSTGKGCHRDDIFLTVNGKDVRSFGSQGQQRTSALSLKLSVLEFMYEETGEYPILLLDDVMSELDPYRKKLLIEFISRVQTFITATDMTALPDMGSIDKEIFNISNGKIM